MTSTAIGQAGTRNDGRHLGVALLVIAHAAAGRTAVSHAAYQHALAAGFDRAFLAGAGIAVLLLVIAIAAIRVRRADLNGSEPR